METNEINENLQGRVRFPIGGIVRERFGAGFGEIPKPTVIVWMKEDISLMGHLVLSAVPFAYRRLKNTNFRGLFLYEEEKR